MATGPGTGSSRSTEVEKVAIQPLWALNTPRQFGPSPRMPPHRAIARRHSWAIRPYSPIPATPEETTPAATAPPAPQDSMLSPAPHAGTAQLTEPGTIASKTYLKQNKYS